ncbi:RNA-dependent RNA polymerase [Shayang Fly Virus 2]|uniref:Replicase n=1 Tax=Shayang Fly Virus 2 TaxID=1608066 RepID=A0A0B5KRH1_9RHAB|nr:RNA-dependent RNA polymerase [Shayang Fly Virus 2]AJG39126.1 RNA-dependent RNA polymerase [Shayang Fly Virus 2]
MVSLEIKSYFIHLLNSRHMKKINNLLKSIDIKLSVKMSFSELLNEDHLWNNDSNESISFDDIDEYDVDPDACMVNLPKMEHLNNVDYSLNSPLTIDETVEFLDFCRNGRAGKRWNLKRWEVRKEIMQPFLQKYRYSDPGKNHQWVGSIGSIQRPNLQRAKEFLETVNKDASETAEVVVAFLRAWLKKDFQYIHKNRVSDDITKWCQFFLEFHQVTLILNSCSKEEMKHLTEKGNGKLLNGKGNAIGALIQTPNFGSIVISEGFCFFLHQGIIADRNLVLMVKDLCAARFHSLFSLCNRHDNLFPDGAWTLLNQFYSEGDKILRSNGNEAFNVIKLIEPACNLRMTQLARWHRPLIPEFEDFGIHVRKSITEVCEKLRVRGDLFKLIDRCEHVEMVLTMYGAFRHWGHPYIDYLNGLKLLHHQVNCDKEIDEEYANKLASDLAYIVLSDQFKKKKTWMVDISKVDKNNLLYPFIQQNTWPTPALIDDFGDHWHELPLIKCFEIPDMFDPSTLYADKSHSMNKDEVIDFMKKNPDRPIPSKKVLYTLLMKPARNWPAFLKQIDEEGLDLNALIIGLKEKEREIKINGRFFSLMSWDLRDYFVITEYLIKTHFVPLFYGLTMADDMTTVVRKMMENTSGQGSDDYEHIGIANHLDYEKWNNHQRYQSTEPVFTVMGKFLGYPNLIARTHEFFEKSFIYHGGRADLMKVVNGSIVNKDPERMVCWQGQKGGLEGLRQKGWSILNLLVIRREGQDRNTKIRCLAQGDNQVICTQYKLQKYRTDEELQDNIKNIVSNNQYILKRIEEGTKKIGLRINQDETMQSADYLNYGKVPIFRGNMRNLEIKRWARVTCVTNDQVPTLANTMSTVSTNALTVAHYSASPINAIFHLNFLSNFARRLIEDHNPAIRASVREKLKDPEKLETREHKVVTAYLDPSLGGVCGTSLTRFLIRQFPDPVTESLSFLKMVYIGTTKLWLRRLICEMGDISVTPAKLADKKKLIENPLSLNIPRGIDILTMIKNKIKEKLLDERGKVKNGLIRGALDYHKREEDSLYAFLFSISPLFPRFISEYKSATFLGITESLIELFQNSRTIRNVFSKYLSRELDFIMVRSEVISYAVLLKYGSTHYIKPMWKCSATYADVLRKASWGQKVLGATVPHPAEFLSVTKIQSGKCSQCEKPGEEALYVGLIIPDGLSDYWRVRGPYAAYLGSSTNESTSILRPWEKETNIPMLTRASNLRKSIGWFVSPESNLAESIYQNLHALTGEDWDRVSANFKRTGSALHRFRCSRQSSGGYAAQSPVKLTRISTTTSTLQDLGDQNYDFMFQTCILYAQMTAGELHDGDPHYGGYHFHFACRECLRPIEEPMLDTDSTYKHKDIHSLLNKWKPVDSVWFTSRMVPELNEGDWSAVPPNEKSFHIGRAEGFLFGEKLTTGRSTAVEGTLFPLTLSKKVNPILYCDGLLDGLLRASSLNVIFRYSVHELKNPKAALIGGVLFLVSKISEDLALQNLWREERFLLLFMSIPHRTPPSYPLKGKDLGSLGRNYLEHRLLRLASVWIRTTSDKSIVWLFSDMGDLRSAGLLGLSTQLVRVLYTNHLTEQTKNQIRERIGLIVALRTESELTEDQLKCVLNGVVTTDSEVRHAAKDMMKYVAAPPQLPKGENWGSELACDVYCTDVPYSPVAKTPTQELSIPRKQNPLISGLQLFQCATGSHYKLRSILICLNIQIRDALCGGDGSGGIGSMVLRMSPRSRLIFNSLLDLSGVNLRGSNPAPPSAINMVGEVAGRCVNLKTAWLNPHDLTDPETWSYFIELKKEYGLHLNLIILDMEAQSEEAILLIIQNLRRYMYQLLEPRCVVIFKTYGVLLLKPTVSCINILGSFFARTQLTFTEVSSSSTSEVYVVFRDLLEGQITHMHPDWDVVVSFVQSLPVFQPDATEFNRALQLKRHNFMKGVPSRYQTDILLDLTDLFRNLGVETGMSYKISSYLNAKRFTRSIDEVIVALIVACNSIVSITRGFPQAPVPPSDQAVLHLGILFSGVGLWASYVCEEFQTYSNIIRVLDGTFPFSWTSVMYQGFHYHRWSVAEKLRVKKYLHLDSKMAAIGQVIRILRRSFPANLGPMNISIINSDLQTFNRNLTIELFELTTNALGAMFSDSLANPSNKPTPSFSSPDLGNIIPHYTS